MKNLIPFLLLLTLLFTACAGAKYAPGNLPDDQLIFGSGSRFSGRSDTYTLLKNGQVFRRSSTDSTMQELKPLSRREAADIFKEVGNLQLFKLDIEQPGNLYYFIELAGKTANSRVTWGSGSYLPPQGIVFLYRDFFALLNSREEGIAQRVKEGVKKKEQPETKPKPEESKPAGW
ncbi:MAG: hypothetical protein RI973_930 [Bacteroidota bacterium]